VDLVFKDETRRLPCVIVLETDPRPRLPLKVTMTSPWMAWGPPQRLSIHIVHADITCEAFIAHINGETIGLSPAREPIAVGRSEALTEVDFDLINFPSFWALASPSTRLTDDQLDIAVGGWHIEIRPPRKSPDLQAFRSTLYSVTHSCTLRKSDGTTFGSGEAQNLLNALHDAMSFAAGQWVAPVFVHGFESDRQITWKEWGTRPLHPNLGRVETWFDTYHANTLAEILPGVLELRKDAERAETFHSALYWYLRSTSIAAGVDGGTILLQAALERLSWQLFVGDRKALSGDGFSRLPADDQLRLLIESCGIPTGIPSGLSDLTSKAKEFNWSDGPKALAAVRNQLVHPSKRKHFPYYDTWMLAKWYVELVLLRMLCFTGEYSDRTKAQRWVGAVVRVPWAKL
jgi:hypothetical protein